MINPQWLELPISRTNLCGPKDVRANEVWLYSKGVKYVYLLFICTASCTTHTLRHQHKKMYLLTCAGNEDSNFLIRVSAVCMKKLCILGHPKCTQWRFGSDWLIVKILVLTAKILIRSYIFRSCCSNNTGDQIYKKDAYYYSLNTIHVYKTFVRFKTSSIISN